MLRYLNTPVTIVWTILAALMALSWIVGNRYGTADPDGVATITIALMIVAFLKVRLVMLHFMDAKVAPFPLRLMVEMWVAGVCLIVLFMYFRPPTVGS